jgi:hypothetical protein
VHSKLAMQKHEPLEKNAMASMLEYVDSYRWSQWIHYGASKGFQCCHNDLKLATIRTMLFDGVHTNGLAMSYIGSFADSVCKYIGSGW